MEVGKLPLLLLWSSALLFTLVHSEPNHHHGHNNDFPWQNLLSSLGIIIENQTNVIANTAEHGAANVDNKERYTSESTVELLDSRTSPGHETPTVAQNGTRVIVTSSNNSNGGGLALGYKIGIPIVSIIFFVCFWYYCCKCCCACCKDDSPNVIVMQQSNTVQPPPQPAPAPQIILQQPIIHQQAPPYYDSSQRWAQPPPQWGPPPQGTQYAPHPMGQQQHYSPNSGYDNAGFNPATAPPPPPYNTGKY